MAAIVLIAWPVPAAVETATWTKLTNLAPGGGGVMLLLTDGTVMVQQGRTRNWMRLTPDARGSYINGAWTLDPIAPMSIRRLYFASHVLPDGRVWLLGGEYTGPGLVANWSSTGEIYDPETNTWAPTSPYPNTPNCPIVRSFGGIVAAGSPVVTGILSTAGWQPGWSVTGTGIPANTLIASVDSPTQIRLSQNATFPLETVLTFTAASSGNTTTGSNIITAIPSTAGFEAGWGVAGAGIPTGSTITSVDSATQIRINNVATATAVGVSLTLNVAHRSAACFGDVPSMLLPSGNILAGNLVNNLTYIYDVAADSWSTPIAKAHNDRSNEETWARMSDGRILNYDVFQSIGTGIGFAERFDPTTNRWSSISPAIGTAVGTLPVLSSPAIGSELGGILRLYDDRMFVIGANGHTALYTPSSNAWAPGPDTLSTLGGEPFLFSADDGPAAILPNGHVIFTADAGLGVTVPANITLGSNIVSSIPSTASLQVGWSISGPGIPAAAFVQAVLSATEVQMSATANVTISGATLKFGAIFSKPTHVFDFDPITETISPVSPPFPNSRLNDIPAYVTRMLMLPTGELLFSDDLSNQLWVYTSAETARQELKPTVSGVTSDGAGVFTLSGTQLTGQSSGSSYGDDVENDQDYPIIRLVSDNGNVYYARTTNWSPIGVGTGATPQTVKFTLNPAMPAGAYSLIVSAAGISSDPVPFTVGPDLTISKHHDGVFSAAQTAAYTISVSNTGSRATSGTVTVSDALPVGLTAISISGTNWDCEQPAGPCARVDLLQPDNSYPTITVNVSVSPTAPASVVNNATVVGGGDVNGLNNSAADPTIISLSTLAPPTLISPANNAVGISLTPTLSWSDVGWALSYDVYLGTSASPPFVGNTLQTSFSPAPLSSGTVYFWRVVAKDASNSVSSPTFSFTPGDAPALRFVPVTPCRVADTRLAPGSYGGPILGAGATRDFTIPGACGIPANAQAFSLNIGVVPATTLGFMTVWPAGQTRPLVSTLNSLDGRIKSSAAIIPAGIGGAVSVFATGSTHVVLDINGYFVRATDPVGLAFYPLPPCRVADTRLTFGPLGGPSLLGNTTRTFPIRSACGIPATAQAYSVNLTVAPGAGHVDYLTAWPSGEAQPFVASLNSLKLGEITANAAILPAGTNGDVDIFVTNDTDLVIDINGYFAPPEVGGLSLYNLTPCRVLDTRESIGSLPLVGIREINVALSGCGAPETAKAYVFNATVVPTNGLLYLTLWPHGTDQPFVSTLNDLDGSITNNMAIVPTNNGSIGAFAFDSTHLIMDIFGYFAP